MKYRAEIDGLRAIAVVPVILFHAGFELFSGGFVGVDVFFVISGYLITSILIDDMENKQFSIVNFYERRARRILPALFLVMFLCTPFAWAWMLPGQMKDFSQSLLAVSLFASNILFWSESGYFDLESEEKPLLHTWSLAVEEQYYVLFPIFMLLAWRFGKNGVFWLILVMAAISLILSEWGWRNAATANFYLAPTRAWELFSGSIAAFLVHRNGVYKNGLLSFIGLFAIVFAIFAYDKYTPFPSVYTLIPVLGVVLIILFSDKEALVTRLLSIKALVGIGLISYSAYLWHQPLFAFARIKAIEPPSTLIMACLSFISIALAFFSWKYVELPFRKKGIVKANKIFSMSILGILVFCFLGVFGGSNKFIDLRYGHQASNLFKVIDDSNEYVWRDKKRFRNLGFDDEKVKVLIVGDSSSGDLINVLKSVDTSSSISFSSLSIYSGCGPIYIDYKRYEQFISKERASVCLSSDNIFSETSTRLISEADVVIFSALWQEWHVQFFEESRKSLTQKFGDKFWWFGNKNLRFPKLHDFHLKKYEFDEFYHYSLEGYEINQELKRIVKDRFIDPYEMFCTDERCRALNSNGEILLYDGVHLTRSGARYFGGLLRTNQPDFISILLNE